MTLTDLMSGSGLTHYAVVALVLFFGAFLSIGLWIWWPSHRARWSSDAQIPLDEAPTSAEDTP